MNSLKTGTMKSKEEILRSVKVNSDGFYTKADVLKAMEVYAEQFGQPQAKDNDAQIKSEWNIRKCFEELRHEKGVHIGLGDIRLTIGMQDEICDLVEKFYGEIKWRKDEPPKDGSRFIGKWTAWIGVVAHVEDNFYIGATERVELYSDPDGWMPIPK